MFKDFESFTPTTMVLVYEFDCEINIKKLFPLIKYDMKNGPIVSVSFDGISRGIKKKDFRNSITLYINQSIDKTVSVKISKNKIHICGITNFESAYIIVAYIIDVISKIIREVDEIKKIPKIKFIKDAYLNDKYDFVKSYRNEYNNVNYLNFLYWLYNLEDIVVGNLKIISLKEAMINYNYDIGFPVDRWNLFLLFNDKKHEGFYTYYNNSINYSVIIIYKDQFSNFHTIIVYKSGLVTQSGKKISEIKNLYNKFMSIVYENKNKILLC